MSAYELERRDEEDGAVYVTLAGELDLTNARELEGRLQAAAPADRPLVLDLNRVAFIDSAALHVLFRLARNRRPGGLGIVVGPEAAIARTLEIAGVHEVATVGETAEQVVAAVGAR